jgi:hypothetical protein
MIVEVKNDQGQVIPEATVTILDPANGLKRSAQTGTEGSCTFTALPLSTYDVTVERQNFNSARLEKVTMIAGETAVLRVTLRPSDGSDKAEITVFGTTEGVRADTHIDETPILGRKMTTLPLLNSAFRQGKVTGDLFLKPTYFVATGMESNSSYFVDGLNITDFIFGDLGSSIGNSDTVQELLATSAFSSADKGRTNHYVVDIVTKSGTNAFHGTAFLNIRDDFMQAKGPFGGTIKPSYSRQRFGGTAGGPLKQDRAFFFLALEGNHANDVTTVGRRNTLARRIEQESAAIPFRSTSLSTKFDFQLSRNTIAVRYLLDKSHGINAGFSQGGRLPEASNFQSQIDSRQQLGTSWTRIFNNNKLNTALFSFVTAENQSAPLSSGPQKVFPTINVGANFRADQHRLERHIQIKDEFSWLVSAHYLKLGVDYDHFAHPEPNSLNLFGAGIIFVPCDFPGEAGCPNAAVDGQIPVQFSIINRQTLTDGLAPPGVRGRIPPIADNLLAFYAQDDFRVTPDLSLNLGLRWDYDQDFVGLKQFNKAKPGRRKPRKKNFQPRLGIVWHLGQIVIRGGFGTIFNQNYLEARQLELLGDGERLPLVRAIGGTLGNPFAALSGSTPPDIYVTSNELAEPYRNTYSVESEWQPSRNVSLSAGYNSERGHHLARFVEINRKADGTVVDARFGSVLETQSIAKTKYDGLSFNFTWSYANKLRFVQHLHLQGSYILSRARSETNELFGYITGVSDLANPSRDQGSSSLDAHHRLVVNSFFELPKNFTVTALVKANSSRPFEIIQNHDFSEGSSTGFYRLPVLERNAGNRQVGTGADVNRAINAFNANPLLVASHGGPLSQVDPTLDLSHPYFTFDLGLTKTFTFRERKRLQLDVTAYNLFNHVNIVGLSSANPSGLQYNVESTNFGRPLGVTSGGMFGANAPRALEFQAKFIF